MKKTLLLLMCLVGAFTCAWAQATPYYVFKTAKSSNTGYANTYDVTIDGMDWSVPGNQDFDGYVRIGGKDLSNVDRVITAKSAMGSSIARIVINHNGVSNASFTVNSVTVQASSTSTFTNIVGAKTITNPDLGVGAAGELEFVNEWETGLYYKIIFNVSNSNKSKNYGIDVKSIDFYASDNVDEREQPTLTWSTDAFTYVIGGDNAAFPTLTKDPSTLTGVKYVSSDEDVATIDATTGTITVKAVGKTNITAVFDGDNNYKSAEATYQLKVALPSTAGYFDFVDWEFPGADDWTSTYAKHVVEYDEAVITFDKANKQSSTITDCPVTKGDVVTLELTDMANDITSISATFKQWGSKEQIITLYISDDGNNFVETGIKTGDFVFNNVLLDEGVKAIRFSFSSQANQVGVADITITTAPAKKDPVIYANDVVEFGSTVTTFKPQTLKVTAVNCTDPVTYSLDGDDVFTVAGNLTAEGGVLTINCTATEVGSYIAVLTLSSTGAHDVEVYLGADVVELAGTGEGTAQSPYDVTRAIAVIDNALNTTDNVYVKGTISKVSSYNDTNKSISYWLDDNAFQAFSGKGINGADFEAKGDLTVGDEVVICGVIKKYNTTYELDKNNYIVAINYAESYPVTFTANGMATFSATKAAIFDDNTPVKAYIATRVEDNTVYMDRVTGTIAANTGLVLMAEEGTVDIELTDAPGTTPDNNLMQPWAPLTTVAASDNTTSNYVLGSLDGVFGFYFLATDITNNTGQGRACLKANTTAGQQLKIRFNDGATTTELEVSPEVFDAIMYNINGVQVDSTYKGIVIKNGKKYINK